MSRPRIIVLIGLPGGGKTTVGRQLARRLGARFADSDALIEQRLGEPIRDYFEREGESAFRDIEQTVIDDLMNSWDGVVATGGGVVLREANRRALRDKALVVYLRSSPEELARRLRHDTKRPLLQVVDPLAKLRELQKGRDQLYRETAQFVVETGRPSVPTLVNMILMQLELAGVLSPTATPSPINAGSASD